MIFALDALGEAVDVSGDYTLTLTADSGCPDLPDEARSRTYNASIVPANPARTRHIVTVRGASLVIGDSDAFDVGVSRDFLALRFQLPFYSTDYPALMEQIASNTYVAFRGTATATVPPAPNVISAEFDGWISYCALKSPLGENDIEIEGCGTPSSRLEPTLSQPVTQARCESRNHRMILARR